MPSKLRPEIKEYRIFVIILMRKEKTENESENENISDIKTRITGIGKTSG